MFFGCPAVSGQAGSSSRHCPVQELLRKAAANVDAVSDDTEGRMAGIGNGLCQAFGTCGVPRRGVEQAAEGDQVRLRTHDQRALTNGCTRRRVWGNGVLTLVIYSVG